VLALLCKMYRQQLEAYAKPIFQLAFDMYQVSTGGKKREGKVLPGLAPLFPALSDLTD
jgi:hypothetical protein